jgi:hypothetical protein
VFSCEVHQSSHIPAVAADGWPALVSAGRDTLVGTCDGYVIELAREGDHGKKTRRMNAWGPDNSPIPGGGLFVQRVPKLTRLLFRII